MATPSAQRGSPDGPENGRVGRRVGIVLSYRHSAPCELFPNVQGQEDGLWEKAEHPAISSSADSAALSPS